MAPLRAFLSLVFSLIVRRVYCVCHQISCSACRDISSWAARKHCCKCQLLSLICQLSDACRVIRPSRTFLRRMINLSSLAKELHHHIHLNRGFKSDLSWWAFLLEHWNGVSLFAIMVRGSSYTTLTSDALGTWGCGAFTSTGE